MGLDFSHCDAHWAYSGFMRFRARLFYEIYRFDLEWMEGFDRDAIDSSKNPCHKPIPWEALHDHPLKPLLNHSDCGGELPANLCYEMGQVLREIVEKWEDYDTHRSRWPYNRCDYDREQALELVQGLLAAGLKNEPLCFR